MSSSSGAYRAWFLFVRSKSGSRILGWGGGAKLKYINKKIFLGVKK